MSKRGSMFSFYVELEDGVREVVRALRDAGINTTGSCHHEGYIEADSHDPTTERRTIWNVMHELKIEDWKADLASSPIGLDFWIIKSKLFVHQKIHLKRKDSHDN